MNVHPRVKEAAVTVSRAIHGKPQFVQSADGACVVYDGISRVGYVIAANTGIERIYEGAPEHEDIARRSSDAMLRAANLSPDLSKWERA